MSIRLDLSDLRVESFSTSHDGEEASLAFGSPSLDGGCSEPGGGCGTQSLNATYCDCSGGPLCTLACVEPSQATSVQACCG
jgi:hypothetical protein